MHLIQRENYWTFRLCYTLHPHLFLSHVTKRHTSIPPPNVNNIYITRQNYNTPPKLELSAYYIHTYIYIHLIKRIASRLYKRTSKESNLEFFESSLVVRLKFASRLIYGAVTTINCAISNVNPTCCSGYSVYRVHDDRGNSYRGCKWQQEGGGEVGRRGTEDTVGKGKRENREREREGISFAEYTPVYLHGGRDLYTG